MPPFGFTLTLKILLFLVAFQQTACPSLRLVQVKMHGFIALVSYFPCKVRRF